MKITNIKRDSKATSAESSLACDFLDRSIDHRIVPDGTRVIVIVVAPIGEGRGRIGIATEGYDEDEQVMLDLRTCLDGVDLAGGVS